MPPQHHGTVPSTPSKPQHGVAATTFAVLLRHRDTLAAATVRVVSLTALAGLLMTATVFALSWPLFTHMRNERIRYHHLEDPYSHDHSDLGLVALWTLPLYLLLLGVGSAALQNVCSRAVAAHVQGSSRTHGSPTTARSTRLRPIVTTYVLRGLIVWTLPLLAFELTRRLTSNVLDTPLPLARGSWPYTLVSASPAAAACLAVLLRLALALAPAAASSGLSPREALRRSWSLTTKTRVGAVRVLATALPLAALTAAVIRLATQLALPLRPLLRDLLEEATGNDFAAYYAGILAPVIVGILTAATLTFPVTATALACLHERLRSDAARTR
ncbi:hypothetical protein OG866_01950 [Streptomyces sp. NBC_00663]|uniref:hypothetical protein n=1 Tax=Streptomyces sp. NBC_00663 TaxID=2975801 RepID=UPI002E37D593|nr:hypothetical protein [Streptomyces sp. NBC_00663]